MKHLRPVAIGLLAAALVTACKPAPPAAERAATPASASTGDQAAKAFDALLDKQWQYQLQHNPEFASIIVFSCTIIVDGSNWLTWGCL